MSDLDLPPDAVAIIGMACRFPGADDHRSFWRLLRDGREGVRRFDRDELRGLGVPDELADDPQYVWASGHLPDVDRFDAAFFRYSPREAEMIDPQQRLFLETAWSAVEDSGYRPTSIPGTVGVFAGAAINKYLLNNVFRNPARRGMEGWDGGIPTGSGPDALPARVAYHLGCTGPSIAVQTACSSGLTAVALAAESLLAGTCDVAIAGGVSVEMPEVPGYRLEPGGLLSTDGRCRPFDAQASGSVFGSGVGAVVLKPLGQALDDADHVWAVLRSWSFNNDGQMRAGFHAPSVDGQTAVILEALSTASLSAADVQYVEGHGSATPVGDAIEIRALNRVFAAAAPGSHLLGSVKGNIGHTDAAAGTAGLIKSVLAIRAGQIPPTLHATTPNGELGGDSPVRLVGEATEWPRATVRRAGVSSFGMGGANAHVIVEQAPAVSCTQATRPYELLLLSAASAAGLQESRSRLADALADGLGEGNAGLRNVGYTLGTGREELPYRSAVVSANVKGAVAELSAPLRREPGPASAGASVTMMFPGVGDAYAGVTTDLYRSETAFRDAVDLCAKLALPLLNVDIRDRLFPEEDWRRPWEPGRSSTQSASGPMRWLRSGGRADGEEARTIFDQPATFVLEYALAQQLLAWGVRPDALIGHSVGEYVAATIAGVFQLGDALRIVIERARLISQLPPGGMLAVTASVSEVEPSLPAGVWIGAVNTPELTVLSGLPDALDAAARELQGRGISTRAVHAEHAYHSPMAEPLCPEIARLLESVTLNPPSQPLISTLTGAWISDEEATSTDYWTTHMCRTVQFAQGIEVLALDQDRTYLEVGPGQTLTAFVHAIIGDQADASERVVSTMQPYASEASSVRSMLGAVGRLWTRGVDLDVSAVVDTGGCRRISLPAYAFERTRHWVERTRFSSEPDPAAHASTPKPASPTHGLAANDAEGASAAGLDAASATRAEQIVVGAWCDLLGYEHISLDDDFFDLGGHSLLGLQLVNRLWQENGIELHHADILRHRTARALAAAVAHQVAVDDWQASTSPPASAAVAAGDASQVSAVGAVTSMGRPSRLADDLEAAAPEERPTLFEGYLRRLLRSVIGHEVASVLERSEMESATTDLLLGLRRELEMPVYPNEIEDRPSLEALSHYLAQQWAYWRRPGRAGARRPDRRRVDSPVAFVMSSPRAGSTLLRVMLAGHADLFCPPELHLMATPDMAARREAEQGSDRNQGIERTLMELLGLDAEAAARRIEEWERKARPTADVFAELVDAARPAMLVDKSPGNARYLETLEAVVDLVPEARFVHLVRHPGAVVESIVRERFTQLMGAGTMDPAEFGEHIWSQYNVNLRDFLASVDADRRCVVRYEDLVRDPQSTMRTICRTLDVEYADDLLRPYEGRRMRDGLGDPNFLRRSSIEAGLADEWRTRAQPLRLNGLTRQLAEEFGYDDVNGG